MNNRVAFVLPRDYAAHALEILPAKLLRQADSARWLVSTILRKLAVKDVDDCGRVRLSWDVLVRVMDRRYVAAIVAALETGQVIETSGYRAGAQSKGYRLCNRLLDDRSVVVHATNPDFIARYQKEASRLAQEQATRVRPIHAALRSAQLRLTVTPEADDILADLPPLTRLGQDVLIQRLRHRTPHFSIGRTDRVFNGLTGVARLLRPALRIDGQRLAAVDVRNSQPALLGLLIHAENHQTGSIRVRDIIIDRPVAPCPLPDSPGSVPDRAPLAKSTAPLGPDADRFCSAVSRGELYKRLCDVTGLTRDQVKVGLMRDVLAKRGWYPSRVEDAFGRLYPSVLRWIQRHKASDHGNLIRDLQRREAELVIHRVCPRLVGQVTAITVHDSIYTAERWLDTVHLGFTDVFAELGFRLPLRCENY